MRTKYKVSEIFYSIQGEGPEVGTPAIFIRLYGCNLNCSFCDTPNGRKVGPFYTDNGNLAVQPDVAYIPVEMTTSETILQVNELVGPTSKKPLVVITGGEPTLQNLVPLIEALLDNEYQVSVETNGIFYPPWMEEVPISVVWVVSPKKVDHKIMYTLEWHDRYNAYFKFVVGGPDDIPTGLPEYADVYLQPLSILPKATEFCIKYLKEVHPDWKLSLQTHKLIGIQ